jgi:hypothetical protein
MKKIVAFFFMLIYSFATVGATIHTHYCMGKAIEASFFKDSHDFCSKCGMPSKDTKGCCKEEAKYLKIKAEHSKTVLHNKFATCCSQFILPTYFITNSPVKFKYNANQKYYKPPLIKYLPPNSQILFCIFLV